MTTTPDTTVAAHRTLATALLAACGILSTAHADTITVCPDGSCDFTDPVAAVAAAADGDVVEIAAGTYLLQGQISVYGPSVEIRGAVDRTGRPATVLDGQGLGAVLGAVLLPSATLRVGNVVITHGAADYGGGIFLRDGATVFENCLITGNHANIQGGGLFMNGGGTVTFVGCEISGNTAAHPSFQTLGQGGAGWIAEGVATLVDSKVRGNSAQHTGGAIGLGNSGEVVLDRSDICGNAWGQDSGQNAGQTVGAGTVTIVDGCISDDCADCPSCPADLTGDGIVGAPDLATMLIAWGACGKACASDLDRDGVVGASDLSILLSSWGICD